MPTRQWVFQEWLRNEWAAHEWVGGEMDSTAGEAVAVTGGIRVVPSFVERDPRLSPWPPSSRGRLYARNRIAGGGSLPGGGPSDVIPPTVLITDVTPSVRSTPVESIVLIFSEPVTGVSLASLRLERDSGGNLLSGSLLIESDDSRIYRLYGLDALTATPGEYRFSVLPNSGITDLAGNALETTAAVLWTMIADPTPDTTPPTVTILPVSPNPRTTSVSAISLVFNEQVSGFDMGDLSLRRDGGSNLLGSGQQLSSSNSISWVLSGLDDITQTDGNYVLSVTASGSGIVDASGNAMSVGASTSWTKATPASQATLPNSTENMGMTLTGIHPTLGIGVAWLNFDGLRPNWPRVVASITYTSQPSDMTDPVTGAPNTAAKYNAALAKFRQETPTSWIGTYLSCTGLRSLEHSLTDCPYPMVCVLYDPAKYPPSWLVPPAGGTTYGINTTIPAAVAQIKADIMAELARRFAAHPLIQYVSSDNVASPRLAGGVSWAAQMDILAGMRSLGKPVVANCSIHYRTETKDMLDLAIDSCDGFIYEATLSKNWCDTAQFTAIVSNLQYMADAGFAHYFIGRGTFHQGTDGIHFQRARTIVGIVNYSGDDSTHGLEVTFSQPHYLETGFTRPLCWFSGVHPAINNQQYLGTLMSGQPTKLRFPSVPHQSSYTAGTCYVRLSDAEFLAGLCLLLRTRTTPFRMACMYDPGLPNPPWFYWADRGYRVGGYSLTVSGGIVQAVDFDLSGGDHVTLYPLDRRVAFS